MSNKGNPCTCMQDTFARARTRPKGQTKLVYKLYTRHPIVARTLGLAAARASKGILHASIQDTLSSRAALDLPLGRARAQAKVS